MKTRLVRIGNLQGVRIPKLLLEQSNLADEMELHAGKNQIVIRSRNQPRRGWENAFRAMAAAGDDKLLDESPSASQWDQEQWQWYW